jgi:hypothetical protein
MEFKCTSDVLPDYFESKDSMSSKQYENFMNTPRKEKTPGWTSEQLNFIVGSKSINEKTMDINLEKIGINQKNKEKIKAATAKTNIHSLLHILKAYYANTHQDQPKPTEIEGSEKLQLAIDTRQTLGKPLPYTHQNPSPPEERHTEQPSSRSDKTYTSLLPQVNYTDGPTSNSPPRPTRSLLKAPPHR